MDIIQLYEDYSLDYRTKGHKHCRPGYVNIECPFCTGNPGYHLSFHLTNEYFICWRCGWKPIVDTIATLLNINWTSANNLIKQYGVLPASYSAPKQINMNKKPHKLPSNVTPLKSSHKKYLIKRKFDPDKLEKEWGLLSCGPISLLKTNEKIIDYRHRILIPIFWDGRQVSFQGRDTTDKVDLRYIACPEVREIIKHKHILYGKQNKWGDVGIWVEGATDVWRFGFNSFCTFGIGYTAKQLRIISKTFKRVPIVFDDDPQAIEEAEAIIHELKFRGVDSFKVVIKGDPAEMKQEEADYLVKQLIN